MFRVRRRLWRCFDCVSLIDRFSLADWRRGRGHVSLIDRFSLTDWRRGRGHVSLIDRFSLTDWRRRGRGHVSLIDRFSLTDWRRGRGRVSLIDRFRFDGLEEERAGPCEFDWQVQFDGLEEERAGPCEFDWQVQFDGLEEERAGPCEFDWRRLIVCFLSEHGRESDALHSMLIAAGRLSSVMNRTEDRINDSRRLRLWRICCASDVCVLLIWSLSWLRSRSPVFTISPLFMTLLRSSQVVV